MESSHYFQIIITTKDFPLVFLLKEDDVSFEEEMKMEEEVGEFPHWCCSIVDGKLHFEEDFMENCIDQNIFGCSTKPRIIKKTLWYRL